MPLGGSCGHCRTCTMPGIFKWPLYFLMLCVHIGMFGTSLLMKRALCRCCPRCGHVLDMHDIPTYVRNS